MLILAGPGSGKTRVIVHRVAHLLEQGIDPSRVAFVVFPRYEPGATTALTRKSPAHALLAISQCSFNFAHHGRSAFDFAGRLVERADCYELLSGDLPAACDLVTELAGCP